MMSNEKNAEYDWASAVVSLLTCASSDIGQLVEVSKLDPKSGDLCDVDFSGVDLRGQNLSGWNLQYANFKGAKLSGADLLNSIIDPFLLIEADDWEHAKLSKDTRANALLAAKLMSPITNFELSVRAENVLRNSNIKRVGDLVSFREAELLRTPNLGRKSFNEIKELLAPMGLFPGMEIRGWPPKIAVEDWLIARERVPRVEK